MYIAESKAVYSSTKKINGANDVFNELQDLQFEMKEHFVAIYLDNANKIISKETVSVGTLNQSMVHPREVFRSAILHNAASIIVAHNHPSGTLQASGADIKVTERLKESGKLIGIELLDHLIIVKDGYLSLRDEDIL